MYPGAPRFSGMKLIRSLPARPAATPYPASANRTIAGRDPDCYREAVRNPVCIPCFSRAMNTRKDVPCSRLRKKAGDPVRPMEWSTVTSAQGRSMPFQPHAFASHSYTTHCLNAIRIRWAASPRPEASSYEGFDPHILRMHSMFRQRFVYLLPEREKQCLLTHRTFC